MDSEVTAWPSLPYDEWQDTRATLHMWTQIVGKVRLSLTPWINHSWHVALYVTSRGLTTSPIPHGSRTFQIDFDFVDHRLYVHVSDGRSRQLALRPCSVADFYGELMAVLGDLGLQVSIHRTPNEVEQAIAFDQDTQHASYDAAYVSRFWQALVQSARVFQVFRSQFTGKCSPVHFFWGSFDLAVSRFSGRAAPTHPGGMPNMPDRVAREAYSHEVSSCGFWPGGDPAPYPLFYSYVYPQPDWFSTARVRPASAFYHDILREFVLPYDEVRRSEDPDALLLQFLQSTYEAAADGGEWPRRSLERDQ